MKNKTFFDSLKCAVVGMIYCFKTEKNFKYYFVIASIFIVINLYAGVSIPGWIGYFVTVAGVFSAEFINTAVEHTLNYITTDIRNEIKIAKDIGSATVIAWGFGFFATEIIAIGQALCM